MTREETESPMPGMWRFLDAANALTLMGLVATVCCVLLAMNGWLAYAVIALMSAGLCDLFDGCVARRGDRSAERREFGGHLDSVVDVCSFGLAPVVLLHASGLNSPFEIALLTCFASATAWRLAYFDTVGLQRHRNASYFTGVPSTYVAIVLPGAYLVGFVDRGWLRISLGAAALFLALGMVSSWPIRKPAGVCYFVFPILGAVLMGVFVVFARRLMVY